MSLRKLAVASFALTALIAGGCSSGNSTPSLLYSDDTGANQPRTIAAKKSTPEPILQYTPTPPPCISQSNCNGGGGGNGSGGSGGSGGGSSNGGFDCMGTPNPVTGSPCQSPPPDIACNGTKTTCADKPCADSPDAIGTTFVDANTDTSVTITDINSLWETSNGVSYEVGWIYLGSNGQKYIQGNLADQISVSFSVNVGLISVGVTPSPGSYTGIKSYTPASLPSDVGAAKCESNGGAILV